MLKGLKSIVINFNKVKLSVLFFKNWSLTAKIYTKLMLSYQTRVENCNQIKSTGVSKAIKTDLINNNCFDIITEILKNLFFIILKPS